MKKKQSVAENLQITYLDTKKISGHYNVFSMLSK